MLGMDRYDTALVAVNGQVFSSSATLKILTPIDNGMCRGRSLF